VTHRFLPDSEPDRSCIARLSARLHQHAPVVEAWPAGLIVGGLLGFVLYRMHAAVNESAEYLAERLRPLDAAELDAAELDALRQSVPKATDLLTRWQRARPVLSIDRAAILDEFER
jgi:hypothetical protein